MIDTCIRQTSVQPAILLCCGSAWSIMGVPPLDPGCWGTIGNHSAQDDTFRKWRCLVIVLCQRGRWGEPGTRQREERMSTRDEASEPFTGEEPSRHQCFTREIEPLLIWLLETLAPRPPPPGWERKARLCYRGRWGGQIQWSEAELDLDLAHATWCQRSDDSPYQGLHVTVPTNIYSDICWYFQPEFGSWQVVKAYETTFN